MSAKTAHNLGILIVIGMIVQLAVIGYVFYASYQGRVNTVTAQRAGCARAKLDRTDNADFQTAQKVYIIKVTDANSVKEDVKRAAREAIKTFNRTSARLTKRSKLVCARAFPKASLFP